MSGDDTATWTKAELDGLHDEFGDTYRGRTCLVTGADGVIGSPLTEAVVERDAQALADQPEEHLCHVEGRSRLPDDELPRRLRHPGDHDAHVQQLRAASDSALRDGDDHLAGALTARDRARCAGAAARLLLHDRRR